MSTQFQCCGGQATNDEQLPAGAKVAKVYHQFTINIVLSNSFVASLLMEIVYSLILAARKTQQHLFFCVDKKKKQEAI